MVHGEVAVDTVCGLYVILFVYKPYNTQGIVYILVEIVSCETRCVTDIRLLALYYGTKPVDKSRETEQDILLGQKVAC